MSDLIYKQADDADRADSSEPNLPNLAKEVTVSTPVKFAIAGHTACRETDMIAYISMYRSWAGSRTANKAYTLPRTAMNPAAYADTTCIPFSHVHAGKAPSCCRCISHEQEGLRCRWRKSTAWLPQITYQISPAWHHACIQCICKCHTCLVIGSPLVYLCLTDLLCLLYTYLRWHGENSLTRAGFVAR